jgi:pteridine reductase
MLNSQPLQGKTALITGAAARLGAMSARYLHAAGAHVVIHYRNSASKAEELLGSLNNLRPDSASMVQADLLNIASLPQLVAESRQASGRLDILVNNASTYYPTPLDEVTESQWDDLFGINAKAPFFLALAAAAELKLHHGCIINMVDIHAQRPNKDFPIYSMAKAAKAMMVQSLAKELAPEIRVNGIAPGAILWPEGELGEVAKLSTLPRIPLARAGKPEDIAHAVLFLATSDYISGQIIAVDGWRTTYQ